MYRLLLHLFPSAWRAEYGAEMQAAFRGRQREASGAVSLIGLWFATIADMLYNAVAIHLDLLRQDLRYARRSLARSPGFTIAAVIIAAVGIGAVTAAFTMVDHVLVRPLPFANPDRLVRLLQRGEQGTWELSPANYQDWHYLSTSFEKMGAYRGLSLNLTGSGEPRMLEGASVTADLFPVLGVQPILGRLFTTQDDRQDAAGTVILSYSLWKGQFGGDFGVLGRTIDLYNLPYTVIGVMPETFFFPTREALLWTPMRWGAGDFEDRMDTYVNAVGLLKPGLPLTRAKAEMQTVTSQLALQHPAELKGIGASVVLLHDDVSRQSVMMLKVLLGAALCVLLIACTNQANLLLARAMVRRRELAVRTALGAGRERLVRQMLTESLVLAAAGGGLGVGIAYLAIPLLVRLVPVALPIAQVPSMDGRVLLFAFALTFLTGIAFGVAPAARVFRGPAAGDLQQGGRAGIGGRHERLRGMLVVTQVAVSIVLLVAFGLLTRALWRVQSVNPGFRAEHVLTLRTSLPMPRYEQPEARDPFYRRVLEETRSLPGVTGAAYVSFLPLVVRGGMWPVAIPEQPEEVPKQRMALLRFLTPDYFRTMGIPLLAGRDVAETDSRQAQKVALVSQSFANRYWKGQNALGHHIGIGNFDRVVIGVVGDVRIRGLERSSEPQVYVSWRQPDNVSPWYAPKDLVVRTTGDAAAIAPALRRIIGAADRDLPVSDIRLMSDIVQGETASRRVQLMVLGAFGAVAFLLAAVGIHSLLSFVVTSRTQEIGVRIALGARRGDILGLTMGEGLWLGLSGVCAGSVLAWGSGRLLEALLAGVKPNDPATYLAAAVLALTMTLVGSLLPALRALRIDPTTAIRTE